MQRDWSNTRLLEQVPAPFVLQVLLPALLREYSHKPAAATATGRVEGSTADPSACASTRTSHQLRCSYSYSYNSLAAATASWWGSEAGCCPNQCSRCCYSQLVEFRGWLLPQCSRCCYSRLEVSAWLRPCQNPTLPNPPIAAHFLPMLSVLSMFFSGFTSWAGLPQLTLPEVPHDRALALAITSCLRRRSA